MSDERINSIASICSITPELNWYGSKIRVKINGCLKQDKSTYTQGTIVNIYIFYEKSKNVYLY